MSCIVMLIYCSVPILFSKSRAYKFVYVERSRIVCEYNIILLYLIGNADTYKKLPGEVVDRP